MKKKVSVDVCVRETDFDRQNERKKGEEERTERERGNNARQRRVKQTA